jgi:hypothetical protein
MAYNAVTTGDNAVTPILTQEGTFLCAYSQTHRSSELRSEISRLGAGGHHR